MMCRHERPERMGTGISGYSLPAVFQVQFQYRGVKHPNIKTISFEQKECVYRGVSYVRNFDAESKVMGFTARKAATDEALAA